MQLMNICLLSFALLTSTLALAQGPGFSIQPDPDLSLAPGGVAAKNVATFQYPPSMDETLTKETFEFISGMTANARMAVNLQCHVKSHAVREIRQFSTGSKWVEYLEIDFETDHFGPRKLKYSFPINSKLGRRITNMDGVGPVEEIKIESGEPYMNWFLFKHDGSRIVWAEMGNIYTFAPCLLRD